MSVSTPLNDSPERVLELRAGETVEVRSEDEILATLDENGLLDGLPFMPEMRRYCGGVFTVYKRAEKTCCEGGGLRRMPDAVFLDGTRCDGSAHGGCGRMCAIFWKEAWVKRSEKSPANQSFPCFETLPERSGPEAPYVCQSTELLKATTPVPLTDLRQYGRDLRGGQMSLLEFGRVFGVLLWNALRRTVGSHDIAGPATNAGHTPVEVLDLRPGEWVEVRSRQEIEATLDPEGKNRGLLFCQEMLHFCGRRYRVLSRVERMILETSGKMCAPSNTVILEGVVCDGRSHRGCMRCSYYLCKEIWLKRVAPPAGDRA